MVRDKSTETVAIIGQGYVGLPLAMALVEANWHVVGFDLDKDKISLLNSGLSPIEDIDNSLILESINSGKYVPTTEIKHLLKAKIIIICVPTPLDEFHNPDLSILKNALQSIAPYIQNESLIISESTSFPGTLRNLVVKEVLNFTLIKNPTFYFAVAPERVNPGDKIWNQKNTPRLVSGLTDNALDKAIEFYETFCDEVIRVNTPEIAEAAKLLENTFRLINISAINEFAQLCYVAGINVNSVIDAAATKPYGFMTFKPGAGAGGHCIPVDPVYLVKWSEKFQFKFKSLENAIRVNSEMPSYIASRIKLLLGEKINPKVLILGIGYKSGLSDTRETPSEKLFDILENFGISAKWYDPLVSQWTKEKCLSLDEKFDAAILITNQPGMDINQLLKNRVPILDCTNTYQNVDGIIQL
jgi:UDP-N-acetyl-D-glucosamine dehydrogenase